MDNSYRYFRNEACKYFPCHKNADPQKFNCLFCYCPMNPYEDCLGTPGFITRESGTVIKDCSNCIFPHVPEHYEQIMDFLKKM